VIRNVNAAAPTPEWMRQRLERSGQRSISALVDVTNYVMLEVGQPLHAFDYDKVKERSNGKAAIVVRQPKPGEKIALLNGKTIEPRAEAIMIATDKQLIGVGGIMGGSETEVRVTTKNIILEAAIFDMYPTRGTAMFHGLFTEPTTPFKRGQSPLQIPPVLNRVVNEIYKHASGQAASHEIDDNHVEQSAMDSGSLHPPVKVATSFINERLGLKLEPQEMKQLLENVRFAVSIEGEDLLVTAPFWRTDIELREDVVEEVGRLYGYDHLPLELPKRDLTPTKRSKLFDTKAAIRQWLSRAGANEILSYTFVPGDLLDKVGQDKAKAYQVANALSPDLQYYRLSLMPSLLEKVHPNIKAGYDEFALFEIGKTHDIDHVDDAGLPTEFEFTGLVVTAADKLKKPGSAYYQARKYLEYLVPGELVFKPISKEMLGYPVVQPYEPGRSAFVSLKNGKFLGIIGEFKPSVGRNVKLPKYTAGFEIDTTVLSSSLLNGPKYQPLSRFPNVSQDITFKVDDKAAFQEIFELLTKELADSSPDDTAIEVVPIDIYQPEASHQRNLTFHVNLTPYNRTLTDATVNEVLDKVAAKLADKLKAYRV